MSAHYICNTCLPLALSCLQNKFQQDLQQQFQKQNEKVFDDIKGMFD
jgi:hypothetical protein